MDVLVSSGYSSWLLLSPSITTSPLLLSLSSCYVLSASYIILRASSFQSFQYPYHMGTTFYFHFSMKCNIKILPWLRNVNIYKVTKLMSGRSGESPIQSVLKGTAQTTTALSQEPMRQRMSLTTFRHLGSVKHSGLKDRSQNHKVPCYFHSLVGELPET